LAACSTVDTRNGFDLQAGESKTFTIGGGTVYKVHVDVEVGKVEVVIRAREKGEFKHYHQTSLVHDEIQEVVVTAITPARGVVITYHKENK